MIVEITPDTGTKEQLSCVDPSQLEWNTDNGILTVWERVRPDDGSHTTILRASYSAGKWLSIKKV